MSQQHPPRPRREIHPVLSGTVALLVVGMMVGLVLGGAAWAGARVLGLGGPDTAGAQDSSARSEGGDRLVLPRLTRTKGPGGPQITLAPDPQAQGGGNGGDDQQNGRQDKKKNNNKNKQDQQPIALSAGQRSVASMQNIDLTGSYPGGAGRIVQVQRFQGGAWTDFPVTVPVNGDTFSTYVATGQTGPNRFRVVDTDTGQRSNQVVVTVG